MRAGITVRFLHSCILNTQKNAWNDEGAPCVFAKWMNRSYYSTLRPQLWQAYHNSIYLPSRKSACRQGLSAWPSTSSCKVLLGSAPLQAPFSQRDPGSKMRPFSSPAPILSVSFLPAMNISKLSAGKLPVRLIPIKLIHKGLCDVFVPFPKSLPHAEGWATGLAKFTLSIRSPKPPLIKIQKRGGKTWF